jgi:hypothetical protein
MELLLGSHVREYGNRVGRLAGFELEPKTLRISRIIFSPDGDLGSHAMSRPIQGVGHVHEDGEIELRVDSDQPDSAARDEVVMLSRASRLISGQRPSGHLVGVDVQLPDRTLASAYLRNHLWTRRFAVPAQEIDFSKTGELRRTNRGR